MIIPTSYKKDLTSSKDSLGWFRQARDLANKAIDRFNCEHIRDLSMSMRHLLRVWRTLRGTISALLKDELESNGVVLNFSRIKLPKAPQQLHKPIDDIGALLSDIKSFNANLHLCCLMTYTMLLRPHREVRCLSFGDFNSDFYSSKS